MLGGERVNLNTHIYLNLKVSSTSNILLLNDKFTATCHIGYMIVITQAHNCLDCHSRNTKCDQNNTVKNVTSFLSQEDKLATVHTDKSQLENMQPI